MIVCHCRAVSDRTIRKAVRSGARTCDQIAAACAATADCGGCAPAIDAIIAAETERGAESGFAPLVELAVIS